MSLPSTLPAPPAALVVKTCGDCGRAFTLDQYLALAAPRDGGEGEGNFGGVLHYRNCCRNTFGVEVMPDGRVVTNEEQVRGLLEDRMAWRPAPDRPCLVCGRTFLPDDATRDTDDAACCSEACASAAEDRSDV